ncbi:MAG: DUF1565 domain-containing protein, partial [Acidimicrobiales bacterium]
MAAFLLAALLLPVVARAESTGRTLSVATWGSDTAAGTVDAPYRTLTHAMTQLAPSDTLLVRGGTYDERVLLSASMTAKGTAARPVTVQAYPNERPVIRGLLKLSGADFWTVSGINVTWSTANTASEHMVQFWGGVGWRFTNAEVWGAKSFSAVNVDDGARDFQLDHLYVHDTYKTNGLNQDHLIYVASNNQDGVIERNVLVNSLNGRGVKVGAGSLSTPASDRITIRYNTFVNNQGPANVQFSGDASGNSVYGNIMVRPHAGESAVTTYELTGTGNVVSNNIAWGAEGVLNATQNLVDGGGNSMMDPGFVDEAAGDFRPTNSSASGFGAHAPGDTPPATVPVTTTVPPVTTTVPPVTTTVPPVTTTVPPVTTTVPPVTT